VSVSRGHASGGGVWGRQHDGDGGLWVVHVECATSGNQFHKAGGAVVVADVERNGQVVRVAVGAKDGKAGHPDNIPKPSNFILAGDTFGCAY
jgi:hypothetical protein